MASQVAPNVQMIWIDPAKHSVRTIFTPQLRLAAEDLEAPSVQEGFEITKRAFDSLKNGADSQGAQFLVVLIPTKERAYCSYLKDSGERMPNTLVRLCDVEQRDKEDLEQFFATRKIAYVDVVGVLEEKIHEHVQIYPMDDDGHPLVTGYSVIANAVYNALRREHLKK